MVNEAIINGEWSKIKSSNVKHRQNRHGCSAIQPRRGTYAPRRPHVWRSQQQTDNYNERQHFYGKSQRYPAGDMAATHRTTGNTTTVTGHRKVSTIMDTFNCRGFKESSDYILSRLANTDFMCLSETWIRPSEHGLIQKIVDAHIVSRSSQYTVFNKSGMTID